MSAPSSAEASNSRPSPKLVSGAWIQAVVPTGRYCRVTWIAGSSGAATVTRLPIAPSVERSSTCAHWPSTSFFQTRTRVTETMPSGVVIVAPFTAELASKVRLSDAGELVTEITLPLSSVLTTLLM